jgi:hypothetical protein
MFPVAPVLPIRVMRAASVEVCSHLTRVPAVAVVPVPLVAMVSELSQGARGARAFHHLSVAVLSLAEAAVVVVALIQRAALVPLGVRVVVVPEVITQWHQAQDRPTRAAAEVLVVILPTAPRVVLVL